MHKTTFWMTGVTLALFAANVQAINVDGQWNDWFSYNGTQHVNWNQGAAAGSLLNPDFRYGNDPDGDAINIYDSTPLTNLPPAPVPEPASMVLLGMGGLGLLLRSRRPTI